MDKDDLTPAERLRFAKYLEKTAKTCRRGAGVIADVFKDYDHATSESKAVIRKLNAKAMACDVVLRELREPDAEPIAVDPRADT